MVPRRRSDKRDRGRADDISAFDGKMVLQFAEGRRQERADGAPRRPPMTMSIRDPGFSRDPGLERTRGGDRPAASNMSGDDHADDPAPDRHIHFSPDPNATEPTPTTA
jgi:hypothetical protein